MSCNLKKKNKRKPDDFITVIKEGKVSSSFPVSIKLIPFVYDVITQAKLTCFFNFRRYDHWDVFFQFYSDYKFLYTFHKVGAHYSSRPLFETFEIRGILGNTGAVSRAGLKGATKVFKHGRRSPWVPTLTGPSPGPWLGTKIALYYWAQSANSFSWVLFVSSYTTAITSPQLPGSFTKLS